MQQRWLIIRVYLSLRVSQRISVGFACLLDKVQQIKIMHIHTVITALENKKVIKDVYVLKA